MRRLILCSCLTFVCGCGSSPTPAVAPAQPAPAATNRAATSTPAPEFPKPALDCDTFKDRVLKDRGKVITKQAFYEKFGKPASLRDVVQHSQPQYGSYSAQDAGRAMQQALLAGPPSVILTYNLSDGVAEVSAVVVKGGWRVSTAKQVQ